MVLAHAGGVAEVLVLLGIPLAAVAVWQLAAKWRSRSTR